MNNTISIEWLADHPAAVTILKEWFEDEWAPYYEPRGPGDAEQDLLEACSRDVLPIARVAFFNGAICGTAALKAESVSTHQHLTPWLAALLVAPAFRRRGVGEQLIAAVEETALWLGFDCICAGTGKEKGAPASLLRSRDWKFVEKGHAGASEVSIFRKALLHQGTTAAGSCIPPQRRRRSSSGTTSDN